MLKSTGQPRFPIQLEITPDKVFASTRQDSSPGTAALIIALGLFVLIRVSYGSVGWIAMTLCVLAAIRQCFPTGQTLQCDRSELVTSKISFFNFHGKFSQKSFPVSSIKQMRFAAVGYSRNPVMGLRFAVNGKDQKALEYLESPEASKILNGLRTLGVDAPIDPGMPMMVEMALERRNSAFRSLTGI